VHHYNSTHYCNTETVFFQYSPSSRPTSHLRCGQVKAWGACHIINRCWSATVETAAVKPSIRVRRQNYRGSIENHQWLAGRCKKLRCLASGWEWRGELAAWRLIAWYHGTHHVKTGVGTRRTRLLHQRQHALVGVVCHGPHTDTPYNTQKSKSRKLKPNKCVSKTHISPYAQLIPGGVVHGPLKGTKHICNQCFSPPPSEHHLQHRTPCVSPYDAAWLRMLHSSFDSWHYRKTFTTPRFWLLTVPITTKPATKSIFLLQ